jgi:DNA end-binding protein Ku
MALRAIWTGHLRVSLVTIPVRLYNAVGTGGKVQLNQLHRNCGRRVKYDVVCPEHGHLEKDEIVKGYEFERGRYVPLEQDVLDSVKLETTRMVDVAQFVGEDEIDAAWLESPYYLAPDGPVAVEAFATFRDAMRRMKRVAVGRVVIGGREKIAAIRPLGNGLAMNTLHYAYEVRKPDAYFEEIPPVQVDDQHLQLGEMLVERLSKPFNPSDFTDRYQDALLDVIKARVSGRRPEVVEERGPATVVDLMEALKRSLEETGGKRKPAADSAPAPTKRKRKAS